MLINCSAKKNNKIPAININKNVIIQIKYVTCLTLFSLLSPTAFPTKVEAADWKPYPGI